jgi:uncharacterized protein (DUF362 family)
MDRKEFIYKSFIIGAGFSFLPFSSILSCNNSHDPLKSRVVQIKDPSVRSGNSFNSDMLIQMVDNGIKHLFQADKPQECWNNLFSKKDVVGVKVNCLSGARGSSHKILVDIIIEKLKQAGVQTGNIIIWDRANEDLASAGYSLNWLDRNKVKCFGNDVSGYDNQLYVNNTIGSLVSTILSKHCTAVINIPVLKDHGIAGVTISMKNFFGAIHNPNKYHVNTGNPFIADLYELDLIRRKTRLTICDALDAQYEGGPPFKPQWFWPLNSLLLAVDGVALDRVGWEIIENKRKEKGFPSLKDVGRNPEYILTAGNKGLGQSNLEKIDWQIV